VAAFLAAALGRRKWLTVRWGWDRGSPGWRPPRVPLVAMPDGARPWAIVGRRARREPLPGAQNTVWTAWMGDVVPSASAGAPSACARA
jgi:hypothetical protein